MKTARTVHQNAVGAIRKPPATTKSAPKDAPTAPREREVLLNWLAASTQLLLDAVRQAARLARIAAAGRGGMTKREEKNSVAIASNESFGGWTKTFTDPRLCAAIVDGLTFGGNIVETGTDSFRLAQTRARLSRHTAADRSSLNRPKADHCRRGMVISMFVSPKVGTAGPQGV